MPLVLPTLYVVKNMIPQNSAPKLRRFQIKKLAFINTILLSSTIAYCNPEKNEINKYEEYIDNT